MVLLPHSSNLDFLLPGPGVATKFTYVVWCLGLAAQQAEALHSNIYIHPIKQQTVAHYAYFLGHELPSITTFTMLRSRTSCGLQNGPVLKGTPTEDIPVRYFSASLSLLQCPTLTQLEFLLCSEMRLKKKFNILRNVYICSLGECLMRSYMPFSCLLDKYEATTSSWFTLLG